MHDVAQGINTATALQSSNPSVQAFKVSEANQSCDLQNKIGAVAQEPFFLHAPAHLGAFALMPQSTTEAIGFFPFNHT